RDSQRWGRCRGSLRGRSHGRHVHRPSLDRWLAFTGISFGSVLLCPPVRGPGGPLWGCGLVWSRCPDRLLASKIGVGRTDWFRPLPPPNRAGGFPAHGSPVSGLV